MRIRCVGLVSVCKAEVGNPYVDSPSGHFLLSCRTLNVPHSSGMSQLFRYLLEAVSPYRIFDVIIEFPNRAESIGEELTRCAQSWTLPSGDVFRIRLISALADGKSWSQIEIELHTSRLTIFAMEEVSSSRAWPAGPAVQGKPSPPGRHCCSTKIGAAQGNAGSIAAHTGAAARWSRSLM
jgi:hypothetical protein